MERDEIARLRALIVRLRLPSLPELHPGDLIERMGLDKKARESGLRWVVPERLGGGTALLAIAKEEVEQELGSFLAELGAYRSEAG